MFGQTVENERERRRDRACVATGSLTGAGLGVLAGALVVPGVVVLGAVGALLGGVASRIVALHISADDWDPPASRRPYVGASSPDDDFAGSYS